MSSGGDQPVFIYTTFGTREDAERIAGELVTKRLAACVNLFPGDPAQDSGAPDLGPEAGILTRIIHERSAAIADPLPRTGVLGVRPLRRIVQIRLGSEPLRVPVRWASPQSRDDPS